MPGHRILPCHTTAQRLDCPVPRAAGLWTAPLDPTGALVSGRRRHACVCPRKVDQGCIGSPPHSPVQGTQPLPIHCLRDAKCQLQWHL